MFDGNIVYNVKYYNDSFRVLGFTAVKSGSRVEFTLEYESSKRYDFSFFNPPDGDVMMKQWQSGIKKGTGSVSWKLSKKEMERLLTVHEMAMIFGFDDRAGVLFFDPRQLEGLLQ